MSRSAAVLIAAIAALVIVGCSTDKGAEAPDEADRTPVGNVEMMNREENEAAPAEDADEAEEVEAVEEPDEVKVVLETTKGEITVELWPDKAPNTVKNFLEYVDDGHYDGTIFHRVIPNFMIQGGGFTAEMEEKPTGDPIRNEADRNVRNEAGTLAMARTPDPHSATAQFFINLVDNRFLDRDQARDGWGYAVFGTVVDGMDVVNEIGGVRTGAAMGGRMQDVPVEPIVIRRARRAE